MFRARPTPEPRHRATRPGRSPGLRVGTWNAHLPRAPKAPSGCTRGGCARAMLTAYSCRDSCGFAPHSRYRNARGSIASGAADGKRCQSRGRCAPQPGAVSTEERSASAAAFGSRECLVDIPGSCETGGAEGDRTPDLVIANDALSQLSYGPVPSLCVPASSPSGAGRGRALAASARPCNGDFACRLRRAARACAGGPAIGPAGAAAGWRSAAPPVAR